MTLRPIPVVKLNRAKPTITGTVGRLITVPIDKLVIDGRYQRLFQARNEQRVRDLIANWNWSLYTPIITAVRGDNWAVIDGQHRAAGALGAGINELPAWETIADEQQQAKAFIAINASPTKVDNMQLWHSRRAADDYDAVMLWDVCARAGVEIARYPLAASIRPPNVTLCPGVLHDLRQKVGNDLLRRSLTIMVAVGTKQGASLITRNIMRSVSRLIATSWAELDDDEIAQGLQLVDFATVTAEATLKARDSGEQIIDCLVEAIHDRLLEALVEEEPPENKRGKK